MDALTESPSLQDTIVEPQDAPQADAGARSRDPIAVADIHVLAGFNPRTYFAATSVADMATSLAADGLIQAITVRPRLHADGYWLVAGETRLRAARMLGWQHIAAHVLDDCDDTRAKRLALLENTRRTDLSVPDQAIRARELLVLNDDDRALTARQLGWGLNVLEARLALLHCSENVREALTRGEIRLGHAELLAGLPSAQQDATLAAVIADNRSVADLKLAIGRIVTPLASAVFDVQGCVGCPHNTSTQAELFENATVAGQCLYAACFQVKTRTALNARKLELAGEYGTVALRSERAFDATIPLTVNGLQGVGAEAFSACRGCANFGAVIEDSLGPSIGEVRAPTCFDRACHILKVEEYQTSIAPPVQSTAAAATDAAQMPDSARRVIAKPKAKTKTVAATPAAVVAVADNAACRAAAELIATDRGVLLAFARMGLLLATHENPGKALAGSGADASPDKFAKRLAQWIEEPVAEQTAALIVACQHAVTRTVERFGQRSNLDPIRVARAINKARALPLAAHLPIDEPFFTAHTRPAIDSLLEQSGFLTWQRAHATPAIRDARIGSMTKQAVVRFVLDAGFDFTGFVPKEIAALARQI